MKYLLNTEIGLMGIWDVHALDFIVDKASYEAAIVKDASITKLLNENNVVIWGVGGDGKRLIDFRIEELLSNEERNHIKTESREYKLVVKSGEVIVGSPEWAGTVQQEGLNDQELGIKSFKLNNGQFKVKIYFLGGDVDRPEFIVCINKISDNEIFSPQVKFETLA